MQTSTSLQEEIVVVPAWLTDQEVVSQYQLGVSWFRVGKPEREGPLTERYLLENLKPISQSGYITGKRDSLALEHLGFILGMLSGQQS